MVVRSRRVAQRNLKVCDVFAHRQERRLILSCFLSTLIDGGNVAVSVVFKLPNEKTEPFFAVLLKCLFMVFFVVKWWLNCTFLETRKFLVFPLERKSSEVWKHLLRLDLEQVVEIKHQLLAKLWDYSVAEWRTSGVRLAQPGLVQYLQMFGLWWHIGDKTLLWS